MQDLKSVLYTAMRRCDEQELAIVKLRNELMKALSRLTKHEACDVQIEIQPPQPRRLSTKGPSEASWKEHC